MTYFFNRVLHCFFLYLSVAVFAFPQCVQAENITLSYANFPPAPTFPCVQMERWAAEVHKRTNGAVTVQTYPGSTLLGARNMWRGVIQGQADIGCISLSYQPGVFPLMSVFEQPLGFTSATAASLAQWDLFVSRQPEEFAPVKVLTLFSSAPSNIMSATPVKTLADLKGLPVRSSGGASAVLKLLGGTPVSLPASETPEALQKGLIKGVLSSYDWLKDFNFARQLRYETTTNFVVYPFAVIMNREAYDALSPEIQTVLDDLGREQAQWTGQYLDAHVKESLAWSKQKYSIEMFEFSKADSARAAALLAPMTEQWKARAQKKNIDGQGVLDEVMRLKAKYDK